VAVFVDAMTFVSSAVFIGTIERREVGSKSVEESSILADIGEGARFLWRQLVLRALAADTAFLSFFGGFYHALYGAFLLRTLEFSPFALGLTVAAGGVGSFAGALMVTRLMRRFGLGRSIVLARLVHEGCTFLIPLAGGPAELAFGMIVFAQLAGDGFWTAADISAVSLRQAVVPDRLLGRVNSGVHVLEYGLLPVGALLSGLLAETLGVRETLLLGAGGMMFGVLFLWLSPLPRIQSAEAAASV
jgi:predicted MFS family arabinose efflux permease